MAKIIKIAQKLPQASFAEIKAQLAARNKEILVHRKDEVGASVFTGKVINLFNLGSKLELHGEGFFAEDRANGLGFRFNKVNNEWVLTC